MVSGNEKNNLPVLKNDTNNIIVYKNDLEEFKLLALTLDLSVVDSVVLNNLRT